MNLRLQLALPDDGAAEQCQGESRPGLDRDWILFVLMTPESCKVGVDKAIQPLGEIRGEYGALFGGANEIPQDAFDRLGVGLSGAVGETCHLPPSEDNAQNRNRSAR